MLENPRSSFWLGLGLGALGGALVTFTLLWWTGLAGAWGIGPARATPPPSAGQLTTAPGAPTSIPAPGAVARGPSDIVVGLGQDYLTRQVREALPADAPIDHDLQIAVSEGSEIVMDSRVRLNLGPLTPSLPARVHVTVAPEAGQLGLALGKVEVGPLPIPGQMLPDALTGILTQVETQLNRQLFESKAFQGMAVQAVRSDKGRLWVEFDDGR